MDDQALPNPDARGQQTTGSTLDASAAGPADHGHQPAPDPGSAVAGSAFARVPIEVTVVLGRACPPLRDLLRMGPESVLPLDRRLDEPVELYVGDRLIARGELEEAEGDPPGRLAVRLTEVADLGAGL